jgi:GNAT superfamily N-acetyltransferase
MDAMTPGLRDHKGATLRVAIPTGIPEEMRHGVREIVSVHADNPRKGHATALMHAVCAEADACGFVLMLEARSFDDGMSEEQLICWYGRFGFVRIQSEPVLMAREPRRVLQ